MKLAQALILRADTQKRLEQLKGRLLDNAKMQENERPSEDPKLLLKELDRLSDELFRLILAINLTNSSAKFENVSLTEMIAKKDTLSQKASVLREFAKSASQKVDLYSNSEIKILSTLNGEILNEIKGDFGIFDKICFLADGSVLGKERYAGKLFCLDATSGERLNPAWLRGECAEADELCVSTDGLRLALISYDKARIIDLKSGNLQLSFELSHVVKRCEAKFERINGEEFLAVRTDYGCFSLYKI